MNCRCLIQSAKQIQQVAVPAPDEFERLRAVLSEELNRRMMADPDMEGLIGPGNHAMMRDNSRNFCRFMSAMFYSHETVVLVQTALWVFRAYRSHGFNTTYWPVDLGTFVEIARKRPTPDTLEAVQPFFQWPVANLPVFVKVSDERLASPMLSERGHDPRYGA